MTSPAAVPAAYRHDPKRATGRDPIKIGSATLKWYDIAPADAPIADTLAAEAQAATRAALGTTIATQAGDCGFVILHRCGEDFYFLLIQLWRGANELWEAVHAKNGATPFAPFAPAYPGIGDVRPTFCVWELGVVAHEAQAWTRLLRSPRNTAAVEGWLQDRFTGTV